MICPFCTKLLEVDEIPIHFISSIKEICYHLKVPPTKDSIIELASFCIKHTDFAQAVKQLLETLERQNGMSDTAS